MIKKYFTYYSKKHASRWLVLLIDLSILLFASFMAYYASSNFTLNFNLNHFLFQTPSLLVFAAISFLAVGSYKSAIRYTGFNDVKNLFKSVFLMTLMTILFMFINKRIKIITGFTIPTSIVFTYAFLGFVLLSSSRIIFKIFFNYLNNNYLSSKRVFIYGVNASEIVIYNALINNATENYEIIGFIDGASSNKKSIKSINGVSVFPICKIDKEFVEIHNVDEIIISTDIIDEKISNYLDALKIKITEVPPIESWINGELTLNKAKKQFKNDDLLGRKPIQINNTNIVKEFIGETLLVTGAAGSIGKELVKQLATFDVKKLILLDQSECDLYDLQQDLKQDGKHNFVSVVADISDGLRVDKLFQEYKPTVVFHLAGYKHEQLMEKTPYEAIKININGTKFLADASARYNVKKFIFTSLDKAVNPNSSIGATKRLAELYITCLLKEGKTKFITTRFGNVLDMQGSLVSLFEKQIEKGGPITIPHKDMSRFFMTVSEAVELILEAGTMGRSGEIFAFDMGQPIKIYDIAKKMIKLSGLNYPKDIHIIETGLNTGEKLHEELMASIESETYTYHKKISIFSSIELNYAKIKSEIEELCFSNRFHHNDILLKMKQLIPECKTDNSDYERLYKRVQSYKKAKGILPEKTNQANIN